MNIIQKLERLEMNKEYDFLFKIVIIGNSSVGKSSLLVRFSDDTFCENYLATIGVDFRFKTIKMGDQTIKLQIWDTAGQERFRTITNAYYKGADGIIMVYDVNSQQSFTDIEEFWLNEIESYAEKTVTLMVLGNKSDMNSSVDQEAVDNFIRKRNLLSQMTSAKTGENVEEAFKQITQKLLEKKLEVIRQQRAKNQGKQTNEEKEKEQTRLKKEKEKKELNCQC